MQIGSLWGYFFGAVSANRSLPVRCNKYRPWKYALCAKTAAKAAVFVSLIMIFNHCADCPALSKNNQPDLFDFDA
jgi:hypothetical protein